MTDHDTDTHRTSIALPEGTFWMFDREIGGEELAGAYDDAVAQVEYRTAGTT